MKTAAKTLKFLDNPLLDSYMPSRARKRKEEDPSLLGEIKGLVQSVYIRKVPSYGNSVFYSLGFLLLVTFVILALSGIIMVIFGPFWWNTTTWGTFVRSIHMWAAFAFGTILILHVFVTFSTSAFLKRKLVWMVGSILLFLVLLEEAFGLGIRGDFVSQWNDLSAADLWNGIGLGYWVNPLNWGALYGWHIAIIPLILMILIAVHFSLVKRRGISTPYRNDIPYSMVEASHKKLYQRALVLTAIIILFALFFRAPYVAPVTIQSVAQSSPNIVAMTLLQEFNHTSGTATYLDTIDPYTFNTRTVYVTIPYNQYINISGSTDAEALFNSENISEQSTNINSAYAYFRDNGTINASVNPSNPLIAVISSLVLMAKSGLYQSSLSYQETSGFDQTYILRFLSDTGTMNTIATKDGLQLQQFGMIKNNPGLWPPGSWWVAPYNLLDITILSNDPNADFDGGMIALGFFVLLILFPFIPYLNKIPDKLRLHKLFWNRFTIPEYKKGKNRRNR